MKSFQLFYYKNVWRVTRGYWLQRFLESLEVLGWPRCLQPLALFYVVGLLRFIKYLALVEMVGWPGLLRPLAPLEAVDWQRFLRPLASHEVLGWPIFLEPLASLEVVGGPDWTLTLFSRFLSSGDLGWPQLSDLETNLLEKIRSRVS